MKKNIKTGTKLPPYPVAPSQPVTEDYFGTSITDDFRNLENLEDPLVKKWLKEEADYANNILSNISGREALIQKMEAYNQRKSSRTFRENVTDDDQYFFLKQEAKEDIPRLFYRKDYTSEDELLFTASDFRKDAGKKYVINYLKPSWNGAHVVVGLNHSGQDMGEIIVIDMVTRKVLPFVIDHCSPSAGVTWLPDNSGFIYIHHPEINPSSDQYSKDNKSVVYKIGADPKDLNIIFSNATHPHLGIQPEEDSLFVGLLSKTDKYLFSIAEVAGAYHNAFFAPVSDLAESYINWKPLFTKGDKVEEFVFDGDQMIYTSSKNASNFQILSTSIENADFNNPTILVEAKEDEVLRQLELTSEGLYFTSRKNGVEAKLYRFQNGKASPIPLPIPSGNNLITSKGKEYPELWVYTQGWLNNIIRYKYQNNQFIEEVTLRPKVHFPEFDNFAVKELLVSSHDGALVPFSIIHQKGIELNGQHPILIEGYGSYGASLGPHFSLEKLIWVEEGGIYCIAHVRGGGEKGDQWYEAGKKANKPNSWKDLIACTEYMIEQGYTSTNKTAIWGRSAGGILVGRAMTDRPDLFAVVISAVGVMNTLRIMDYTANGPKNVEEFGSSKNPEECKSLIEMDAYLQLQKGVKYPATLLTAGIHDQRVLAWIPGKFAAQAQRYTSSDKPILFKVDYGDGHAGDGTRAKNYQKFADFFCFTFWQMKHRHYKLETTKTYEKSKLLLKC